ncbi:MAG: hypothetical protein WCG16_07500, partial [Methylococcales bacterium]
LFRLCQHLGLTATQLQTATKDELLALLNILDNFNITERSKIWLYAYDGACGGQHGGSSAD